MMKKCSENIKRFFATTGTLVAAALLLLSCGEGRRSIVIGVSQCSQDVWREKFISELDMSTNFYNEDVRVVVATANDDDRRQIAQIDSLVAAGVDLLIVSPNQEGIITEAVDRAFDKGIPVIFFDRKCKTKKYTAFIGSDNVEMGRTMADYIAKTLGGKGGVVEIGGLKASSPAQERHKGFAEVMAKYPDMKIVAVAAGDWTQESGRKAMDSLLRSGVRCDCVFGQNDRMALGAYEAAKSRGVDSSMIFTGIDALGGEGNGLDMVERGVFAASYVYPTRGDLVMQLAMNILTDKPYSRENPLNTTIVTKENAAALSMQSEELSAQYRRIMTLHDKVDIFLTQYAHQKVYLVLTLIIVALILVSFVAIFKWLLERNRMAEEAANAKLVFFTNVSHEFRTPLTLITDPVENLSKAENLTAEQHGMLDIVRKNANLMLRLVDEILDLRRIQNHKMDLRLCRFDMSEAVSLWTECFVPAARMKGLDVRKDFGDGITVSADMGKVERIFYNLMSNAMKYTPSGGSITVRLRKVESDQRRNDACGGGKRPYDVVLDVSDTGCGIAHDKLARVFERFFQAHGEQAGSTGIGLAIVKAFTELHGGTVAVESQENVGSTFTVTLPQGGDNADEPLAEVAPTVGAGLATCAGLSTEQYAELRNREKITSPTAEEKPKLLIVDDNADVREYMTMIVGRQFDVLQAADGSEGVEMARRDVPDIIISDVMMPVVDGFEMCRRLKSDTVTSHIPIILLTAAAMDSQRAEGYDCGADAYISKPFSREVVLSRVRNLLEQRRRLEEKYKAVVTVARGGDEKEEELLSKDEEFMMAFSEKVRQELSDTSLGVETLSGQMNMSRVQLYRKVKALTGDTPAHLIRLARLKRADELLAAGRLSVSEVAYEVGFSSPSYFTKCYKDQFGVTPGRKE